MLYRGDLKQTTFYIDEKTLVRLKTQALNQNISYSELLRRLVDDYLEPIYNKN